MTLAPRLSALGRRISVVGAGGKTTLADRISAAIGVPHIELDAMFWRPNWAESDSADFRSRVADVLREHRGGWVCDGNYFTKLGDLIVSRADTVILVDMPWSVMFRRVLVRGFSRAWDGRRICGDNRETWRRFLSRESLWWWHIENRKDYGKRVARVVAATPTSTRFIRLDTPRQLDRFYERFGLVR